VDLPSSLSYSSEPRAGGIALSSALLAVPVVAAFHLPGGILLAAAVLATTLVVERRAYVAQRSIERSRRGLTLARRPARTHPAHVAPHAHWEIVERDGRRSLSMRWD
jgi:hypothetical protein